MIKRFFCSTELRRLSSKILESKHGILCKRAYRNLQVAELYEVGASREPVNPGTTKSVISSTGALCAYSGEKTGRSPRDKRIVCDEKTENEIWWGNVNMKMTPNKFKEVEELAKNYLSNKDRVYVTDGYIGYDKKYRYKVRIICTRAYHA